jgi:plasmid stabilization system protein ParE
VKPVVFTPAAEADVEEAFQWYEAQRQGLGATFRHALDIAVAAVEGNTEAYPVVRLNTRRVPLPRFPYGLYYRVVGEEVGARIGL